MNIVRSEPLVSEIESYWVLLLFNGACSSTVLFLLCSRKIGCGQVEELIKQAETELTVIPLILKWRAWEKNDIPAPNGQWSLPH